MKKFILLMLLCLLLCAVSTTAFAATVTYYDEEYNDEQSFEVDGGTYALLEYADTGLALPEGKTFYGWRVPGYNAYLKPGCKIDLKEDDDKDIIAHYVNEGESYFEAKYVSQKYNEHNIIGYSPCVPDEYIRIVYPYSYGFGTDTENHENFLYWSVEGEIEKFDSSQIPDSPEVGFLRLFPRAFADDNVTLEPGDEFLAKSDLTITAVWRDGSNQGGGGENTNPGGGGENTNPGGGGENTNPGGGGENTNPDGGNPPSGNNPPSGGNTESGSKKLPKTGDESLPMGVLLVLMAASLCGIAVLVKRKFN